MICRGTKLQDQKRQREPYYTIHLAIESWEFILQKKKSHPRNYKKIYDILKLTWMTYETPKIMRILCNIYTVATFQRETINFYKIFKGVYDSQKKLRTTRAAREKRRSQRESNSGEHQHIKKKNPEAHQMRLTNLKI